MKKYLLAICLMFLSGIFSSAYAKVIQIGASVPDFASIASFIGGDKVKVFSIIKNYQNPHSVNVLPSYMIKVSKCDIFLKVGLSSDVWADEIIEGSRNNKVDIVDCSEGIRLLEKPSGNIDFSRGHVHPEGNPHYWLNPENGAIVAEHTLKALEKVDPENMSYYKANYEKFKKEINSKIIMWEKRAAKIKNKNILTYHSSWVYFADFFGFTIIGNVEPLPGIPPSGKHLSQLVEIIKKNHIKYLFKEPYFPNQAPKFLERETGVKTVKVSTSCSGEGKENYFNFFDKILDKLSK